MMTTRFKASQFRMEMERAFTNRTFLFCVAAIAFLFVYPVLQEWQYGFPRETGFMYYYRYSHRLSRFREVSLILSALPYVASFCVDWNSGYIKSEIIRGNHKRYAISKYITVGISSYATLFLGIIGFAAFLALTTPINANLSNYDGTLYSAALLDENVALYVLASASSMAVGAAFLSMLSLCFSTWVMNNYITLILPFVVYNVFNAIAVFMGLPIYLDITYLMMPELLVDLGFQASAPIYWLYIQGFFIVLIVLLGWVFTRRVKRRLEDVQ